jgi:uncharacterized protein YjeT (DUF2065 family)
MDMQDTLPRERKGKVDVGLVSGVTLAVIVVLILCGIGFFIMKRWRRTAQLLQSEESEHEEWLSPSM